MNLGLVKFLGVLALLFCKDTIFFFGGGGWVGAGGEEVVGLINLG